MSAKNITDCYQIKEELWEHCTDSQIELEFQSDEREFPSGDRVDDDDHNDDDYGELAPNAVS